MKKFLKWGLAPLVVLAAFTFAGASSAEAGWGLSFRFGGHHGHHYGHHHHGHYGHHHYQPRYYRSYTHRYHHYPRYHYGSHYGYGCY